MSVLAAMADVIAGHMRSFRQSRARLAVPSVPFSAGACRCSSIAMLSTRCISNSFLHGTSSSIRVEFAFECIAVDAAS